MAGEKYWRIFIPYIVYFRFDVFDFFSYSNVKSSMNTVPLTERAINKAGIDIFLPNFVVTLAAEERDNREMV